MNNANQLAERFFTAITTHPVKQHFLTYANRRRNMAKADAEELYSATMLQVAERLLDSTNNHKFESETDLLNYFYSTLKFELTPSSKKSTSKNRLQVLDPATDFFMDVEDDGVDEQGAHEARNAAIADMLLEKMELLTPEHRAVLKGKYLNGQTQKQLCDTLNIKKWVLVERLEEARMALRKLAVVEKDLLEDQFFGRESEFDFEV